MLACLVTLLGKLNLRSHKAESQLWYAYKSKQEYYITQKPEKTLGFRVTCCMIEGLESLTHLSVSACYLFNHQEC